MPEGRQEIAAAKAGTEGPGDQGTEGSKDQEAIGIPANPVGLQANATTAGRGANPSLVASSNRAVTSRLAVNSNHVVTSNRVASSNRVVNSSPVASSSLAVTSSRVATSSPAANSNHVVSSNRAATSSLAASSNLVTNFAARAHAARAVSTGATFRAGAETGPHRHSVANATGDSVDAKEPDAPTQEERSPHSARGPVASSGRARREDFHGQADLRDRADSQSQVDFQNRAGRLVEQIEADRGSAANGPAGAKSSGGSTIERCGLPRKRAVQLSRARNRRKRPTSEAGPLTLSRTRFPS